MVEEKKTHYIVQVALKPRKEFCGTGVRWHWLALAGDSSGKYPSHMSMKGCAQKFDSEPSLLEIREYSGYPWYDEHDFRYAPRIFKVTETRTEEQV